MNLFTPEDLLEYYYQETSPERSLLIAEALQNNWALRQKYEVICQAATWLDKSVVSPRAEAVQAILDYAGHSATASV
jgi:hypothetical protein